MYVINNIYIICLCKGILTQLTLSTPTVHPVFWWGLECSTLALWRPSMGSIWRLHRSGSCIARRGSVVFTVMTLGEKVTLGSFRMATQSFHNHRSGYSWVLDLSYYSIYGGVPVIYPDQLMVLGYLLLQPKFNIIPGFQSCLSGWICTG